MRVNEMDELINPPTTYDLVAGWMDVCDFLLICFQRLQGRQAQPRSGGGTAEAGGGGGRVSRAAHGAVRRSRRTDARRGVAGHRSGGTPEAGKLYPTINPAAKDTHTHARLVLLCGSLRRLAPLSRAFPILPPVFFFFFKFFCISQLCPCAAHHLSPLFAPSQQAERGLEASSKEWASLRERVEASKGILREASTGADEAGRRLDDVRGKVRSAQSEEAALRERCSGLSARATEAQAAADRLRGELDDLRCVELLAPTAAAAAAAHIRAVFLPLFGFLLFLLSCTKCVFLLRRNAL